MKGGGKRGNHDDKKISSVVLTKSKSRSYPRTRLSRFTLTDLTEKTWISRLHGNDETPRGMLSIVSTAVVSPGI